MAYFKPTTKRGYDFFEVSSSLQKAIRRNDPKIAGYFAMELFASNYANYTWKRLLTITAEDCYGILTQEIWALYQSYLFINKGAKAPKGRIFITKAVMLLCEVSKSRDADHLQNLVYDRKMDITDTEIGDALYDSGEYIEIPDYAYDMHTLKGKRAGENVDTFIKKEQKGLKPRVPGFFDHLVAPTITKEKFD